MKLTTPDFLVLNLQGIDLFIQAVDLMAKATGSPYEECVRETQKQIREYAARRDAFNSRPTVSAVANPLTMTLRELLNRNTCDSPAFRGVSLNVVYIIRNGESVLYVGSTRYDARSRVKSHQKAHSPLGKGLREDPNAPNWSVEMIPHADYREAAQMEKRLINQLSPAFCRRT